METKAIKEYIANNYIENDYNTTIFNISVELKDVKKAIQTHIDLKEKSEMYEKLSKKYNNISFWCAILTGISSLIFFSLCFVQKV